MTTAHRTVHEVTAGKGFERFARAGYVARGVLYILMGVLAIELAFGQASDRPNQEGAFHLVADQTFGRVLLVLIAIGLLGYTILRFTQALIGRTPEAGRHSAADRVSALASGCAYGIFFGLAVAVLVGSAGGNRGGEPKQATADVMGWTAGRWIVLAAGVVFAGVAVYQAWMGLGRRFLEYTKTERMSRVGLRNFTVLGVVGHVARAIVFGLVAAFLIKAAVEYDPKEAVGIDGALQRLQDHAYGTVALVAVAIGLIAFGVYSAVDARYRKI
jgi:hypothetical protein